MIVFFWCVILLVCFPFSVLTATGLVISYNKVSFLFEDGSIMASDSVLFPFTNFSFDPFKTCQFRFTSFNMTLPNLSQPISFNNCLITLLVSESSIPV